MTALRTSGLAPVRQQLTNGLTVLVQPTRVQPSVTISAAVAGGSVCDPPDREGAAHLLSMLLDRGAGARTADDIADLFDLRGVSPAIGAARHATTVTCGTLAEDVETVLEVVCDMLRAPRCPEEEIDRRRGQLLTQLREDEDNPAARALQAAMTLLYGDAHPYGRPPKGSARTLAAIDRRQLLDAHAAWFAPDRVTLVLVGDISPSAALDIVTRVCGDWATRDVPAPVLPPPPAPARRRVVVPMPAKAQAAIVYGLTTIPRSDPAFYAYWVMNTVLGQYGIGGRLGRSIRERQGMAYYAGSVLEASHIAGPLLVRAGVHADNVDRALASIDAEVAAVAGAGVTSEELANAKRYLVGSIPRSIETNAGIARFLQTSEQFALGLDYDARLPELIEAVTPEAVAGAARRTLVPEHAAVAIAGPYEDS